MPPSCTNCGKPTKYSARPTLMVVTPRAFTVKPGYEPACGDFIEGRPPSAGCVLDPGHAGDHRDGHGGTWPNGPPPITRSLAHRYDPNKDVTTVTAIGAIHSYYCEGCTGVALDRITGAGFTVAGGALTRDELLRWHKAEAQRLEPEVAAATAAAAAIAAVMGSTAPEDVEGARVWNGGKCLAHGIGSCVVCWIKAGRPGPEP